MNERDYELAKQVGLQPFEDCGPKYVYKMEKFADLIRADERERIKVANAPEIDRINTHIKNLEDAVKNEREACAKVCDFEWGTDAEKDAGMMFAAVIRARGNT